MSNYFREINNPENFRNNIKNEIKKMINNKEKLSLNIEKSIYNYTIDISEKKQIIFGYN